MARKVWYIASITNNPAFDISDAERFGKLFPIFEHLPTYHVHDQKQSLLRQVFPIAGPDDLIILAGPAPMVMTLTVLWFLRFRSIRFLFWDARKMCYIERFLNSEGMEILALLDTDAVDENLKPNLTLTDLGTSTTSLIRRP